MTQQVVADRIERPQSFIAKVEGFERRLDVLEFVLLAHAVGANPVEIISQLTSEIEDQSQPPQ